MQTETMRWRLRVETLRVGRNSAKKQSRQIKKTARFKMYTYQKGLKSRLSCYIDIK